MKKIQTHYDNLKVSRSAPTEVIRAAYRALCQKYHPDRNPANPEAGRIMAIINASYEVLSDPIKRREHDEWIDRQEQSASRASAPDSESSSSSVQRPDPVAKAFGLSEEEIEYLGKPIEATRYRKKYWVSERRLSKAISLGKIRSVKCRGTLWVQDRRIA